jgi:hypothetical protein
MSNGKGYALVIVSLIIGSIGVGMGTYSALNFAVIEGPQGDPGENGADGINGTLNNVIGVWENIEGGPANFFALNLSNNVVSENGYYNLDQGFNFTFVRAGWYRFSIKFLWTSLLSTSTYNFMILKNGSLVEQILEKVDYPTQTTHLVDTTAYLYSDGGDDYYHLTCAYVSGADPTMIGIANYYNQVVLEYVKDA